MHRVTVPALGFRNRIVQKIEVGKQQTRYGQGPEMVIHR